MPSPAPTPAEHEAIDSTIQTMHQDSAAARHTRREQLRHDRRALTDILLGEHMHPADFPTIVRHLHNEIQALPQLHTALNRRGI